jgi:hypothetical protein
MKYLLEIFLIGAECGLAALGLFENVSAKLRWWNTVFDDSLKATSSILLLMVAVLAAYVALKLASEGARSVEIKSEIERKSRELDRVAAEIKQTVEAYFSPDMTVEVVHEQNFYARFSEKIRNARLLAYISHLDVVPPAVYYLEGSAAYDYYTQIFHIIRNNSKLLVRRLERVSKEKIPWIEEHIRQLGGAPNFSLSCFVELPETALPKGVSVQCVDETDAVLVAVARHSNPTEPRDIWLTGDLVARMWRDYFEQRLWASAQPIIVKGVVDAAAWNALKARLQ